jgi:hypothetical protein
MTRRRISGVALALAVLLNGGAADCQTPGEIHYMTLPASPPPRAEHAQSGRVLHPEGVSNDGAVVAIYYKRPNGSTYICSGVLITRQLVLTAGHCGCGLAGTYWIDTRQDARASDPARLLPVYGAPILFDQQVCRSGTLANGNDLALIRLQYEIDQEYLDTIDLKQWPGFGYPSGFVIDLRRQIAKGSQLKVIGYGYTESRSIGVRNQGEVPVYSFDCEERVLSGVCAPFTEMILAGGAANRPANDTCGGDSGGPVYWIDADGFLQLVAITSRAAPGVQQDEALHCGGGGIYTLIGRTSVYDWLRANGVDVAGSDSMNPRPRLTPEERKALKVQKCKDEAHSDHGFKFEKCMLEP